MGNDKFVSYLIQILTSLKWPIFRNRNWKPLETHRVGSRHQQTRVAHPQISFVIPFDFSLGLEPQNHSVRARYLLCILVSLCLRCLCSVETGKVDKTNDDYEYDSLRLTASPLRFRLNIHR